MGPRKKGQISKKRSSMNMTPLIDVIFLLMIFFVMTINLQSPEGVLDNLLPQISSHNSSEPSQDWETVRLRIGMVKEESILKIYLQDRLLYTYSDLLHYLKLLPPDVVIEIEPNGDVLYKHVIGVYNTCLKAKKTNIVFAISG